MIHGKLIGILKCLGPYTLSRCLVHPARLFSPVNKQMVSKEQRPKESLVQMLREEYQIEKERYTEFTEGAEFIKESGFTVIEKPNDTEIKLVKNMGSKLVEIRYQASELTNDDDAMQMDEEEEEGQKVNDEDKQNDGRTRADFIVSVKDEDGGGIVFTCTSEGTELNIFSVAYTKNVEGFLKSFGSENKEIPYFGPTFENLDEKVQKAFYDYLESLGVTDKLLAYIECSAVDKEQKMYIDWLQNVKEFLESEKK